VVRAVVGVLGRLRAVSRDPRLVAGLSGIPGLAGALAGRPDVLADENAFSAFLRNGDLVGRLGRPGRGGVVAAVIGSEELLGAVMRVPVLVDVLAGEPRLADRVEVVEVLGRDAGLRRLVLSNAELAAALVVAPGLVGVLTGSRGSSRVEVLEMYPHLVGALRGNYGLIREWMAGSALWKAVVTSPGLAGRMTVELSRVLQRYPRLVGLLVHPAIKQLPDRSRHAAALAGMVLGNPKVAAYWEHKPADLAVKFLSRPEWLDVAAGDPAFAGKLQMLYRRDRSSFIAFLDAGDPQPLLDALARPEQPGVSAGSVVAPRVGAGVGRVRVVRPVVDMGVVVAAGVSPEVSPTISPVAVRSAVGVGAGGLSVVELLRSDGPALDFLVSEHEAAGVLLAGLGDSVEGFALLARSDLVERLEHGASPAPYLFTSFLASRGVPLDQPSAWTRDRFATDLTEFLEGIEASGYFGDVEPYAWHTWLRARMDQARVVLGDSGGRASRLKELRPADYRTWEHSGRVHYAKAVSPGFDNVREAIARLASDPVGLRESLAHVALNSPLHAHVARGGGGVSVMYVLADDGLVDLLVYAVSFARQGNRYQWVGAGKGYVDGPASREAVGGDPVLARSVALVERLSDVAGREAFVDSTAGLDRARAAERLAGEQARYLPVLDDVDRVLGALVEYRAAAREVGRSGGEVAAPVVGRGKGRVGVRGGSDKAAGDGFAAFLGAVAGLRAVGLEPRLGAQIPAGLRKQVQAPAPTDTDTTAEPRGGGVEPLLGGGERLGDQQGMRRAESSQAQQAVQQYVAANDNYDQARQEHKRAMETRGNSTDGESRLEAAVRRLRESRAQWDASARRLEELGITLPVGGSQAERGFQGLLGGARGDLDSSEESSLFGDG
jgi:hypothetical protein